MKAHPVNPSAPLAFGHSGAKKSLTTFLYAIFATGTRRKIQVIL